MAAIKRSYVDEHDDTCQPALKRPKIQNSSVPTPVYQATRKSLRIHNRERGKVQSLRSRTFADSLSTQISDWQQEGERGKRSREGNPGLDNTIYNGPLIKTGSRPQLRKKRNISSLSARESRNSSHQAPLINASCQTDGLDAKGIYYCPQCSLPCWLCNTSKFADKPPPEPIKNKAMPGESTTDTSYLTSSETSKKRKRPEGWLGPKDKGFESKILAAVGVKINEKIQFLKPEDVFPEAGQRDSRIKSEIFLSIDHEEATKISYQFIQFHQRECDENTLTKIAVKTLAPFDTFITRDDPETVISLCRDKWKPGKNGPPVPFQLEYTYDWDIEPDMTYMPSINMFNTDLRDDLFESGFEYLVADPHGVCPYLTLEFKCNEKTGKDSDAKCQIAVASVLWLHQRLQMKLALNSGGLNSIELKDLQHYSIVINSTGFQVWVTIFNGMKYEMKMIWAGPMNLPEGIEMYVKWWNAIHAWGLGTNAQSFKKDVEAFREKKMKKPTINSRPTPPRSDEQARSSLSA